MGPWRRLPGPGHGHGQGQQPGPPARGQQALPWPAHSRGYGRPRPPAWPPGPTAGHRAPSLGTPAPPTAPACQASTSPWARPWGGAAMAASRRRRAAVPSEGSAGGRAARRGLVAGRWPPCLPVAAATGGWLATPYVACGPAAGAAVPRPYGAGPPTADRVPRQQAPAAVVAHQPRDGWCLVAAARYGEAATPRR